MSWPLTTAHTSAEGACWCLHPAAKKTAITAADTIARLTMIGFFLLERLFTNGGPNRRSRSFFHAARCGLFHAAGRNTGSANAKLLTRAVHQGMHATQIGIPAAPARVV